MKSSVQALASIQRAVNKLDMSTSARDQNYEGVCHEQHSGSNLYVEAWTPASRVAQGGLGVGRCWIMPDQEPNNDNVPPYLM